MVNIDYYARVGYALELLAQSEYHRQYSLGDYFRVEILPALWCGQARFYLTPDGVPTALVTWAWLSEEVERDVHAAGRALKRDEWTCGDRLFFNDWITPYENIREVLQDMTQNMFLDEVATSLRRNPDGSVRRVNRWTGANVRKKPKLPSVAPLTFTGLQEDTSFFPLERFPGLVDLQRHWQEIRDELHCLDFDELHIHRDGKSHVEVAAEVEAYVRKGGQYGWLKGWGDEAQRRKWTQLGLVVQDQEVPYLRGRMRRTMQLLGRMSGIKVAALLKMKPGTFLETHTHPELAEQGLLQMHLTLEAAETRNFAYLNVDGAFQQHVPGEAFVFDGSKPHFAVNASDQDRVILYLEFDPVLAKRIREPIHLVTVE
jgi:hemolysin-activating ACP:hemolysin acyltransferase/aspartyl/asparaginyl beta-hydroxylase (cupin superfamily)